LKRRADAVGCAQKPVARHQSIDKEKVVARDGIEPPTPAFRRAASISWALRAKACRAASID
jgi:hypothetical protein